MRNDHSIAGTTILQTTLEDREEAKCLWTPYTHLFFRGSISYWWYNPQPMRNDHSIAGMKKSSKKLKKSSGNESDKMKFKESQKSTSRPSNTSRIFCDCTSRRPSPSSISNQPSTADRRRKVQAFFLNFFFSLFARFLSIYLYIFIILTFTCTLHTSLLLTCTSSLS